MPNPYQPDTYKHFVYEQIAPIKPMRAAMVPLPEPLKRLYKHKPMTPHVLCSVIHVIASEIGREYMTREVIGKGVIACRVK